MRTTIQFKATGRDLFKELFVGLLLTSITLGVYYPWFLVSLQKRILRSTTLHVGDEELRLDYTGTGGELFKHMFLGYLFTMWSFGIYLPWFVVRMIRFQQEHTVAIGRDSAYRFHTELTGEKFFGAIIGPLMLTAVTFGIYMPWLLVTTIRTIVEASELRADGERIGSARFTLSGGAIFGEFVVGYLLTMITFGIYGSWFQVKMWRVFANALEIRVGDRNLRGDFKGTGGELFKIAFVGYLLTMVTFGVYGFWLIANLLRFQLSNLRFVPTAEATGEIMEEDESPRALVQVDVDGAQLEIEPSVAYAAERSPDPRPPRALPAREPAPADGDRRAAWARAFLPPIDAVEPLEWTLTLQDNNFATEVWTDRVTAQEIGPAN